MAEKVEENNEGRYPLKKKYRVKPETKKGTYQNRTGGNAPPKNRNKHNAKARGAMGIVAPRKMVLLVQAGSGKSTLVPEDSLSD